MRSRRRRFGRAASGGWRRRASRPRESSAAVAAIVKALADEGPLSSRDLRERSSPRASAPRARPSTTCSSRRRWTASSCGGRWRASSTPTCSSATGSPKAKPIDRDDGARPSSPAATSPATARPTTATSRAGPASRCGQARRGLTGISSELKDLGDGLVRPEEAQTARRAPAAAAARRLRAVPARVDLARGHRRRREPKNLVTVGGMFYPFAMVRGRAVAQVEARGRRARARPVPPHREGRPRGARAGRRRRRALPRLACAHGPERARRAEPRRLERGRAQLGRERPRRRGRARRRGGGCGRSPRRSCRSSRTCRGLDVLDLGCGTGYLCAWFMRLGASPVGLDLSENQLATARELQQEHGIEFPLIHASAEDPPLQDASFDLVFSEYGAAIWCDPYVWIPHAHRLLRPGGRLIFLCHSVLDILCAPTERRADAGDAPAAAARPRPDRLARPGRDRLPPASRRAHRAPARHGLRGRGAARALRARGRPRGGSLLRAARLGAEVAVRGGLGGAPKES